MSLLRAEGLSKARRQNKQIGIRLKKGAMERGGVNGGRISRAVVLGMTS